MECVGRRLDMREADSDKHETMRHKKGAAADQQARTGWHDGGGQTAGVSLWGLGKRLLRVAVCGVCRCGGAWLK